MPPYAHKGRGATRMEKVSLQTTASAWANWSWQLNTKHQRTYRAPAGCASAWPSYSSPAVPCKPQSVSFLYPAHLFVPRASSSLPGTGFGKLHLLVRYKGGKRRALNKPAIQTVHTTAFLIICGENLSHTSTQMCKKRRDSLLMCT